MTDLPRGVATSPLRPEDVDDVVALVNACELHDSGHVMLERADLLADLASAGFDPGRDAVVLREGGRPVGWGMVLHLRSRWADVHPKARGSGLGTWLMRWSEQRGREIGSPRIGQTIADGRADVARMFTDAGYTPRRTSWVLRMDHPERPADREPPAGIEIRPLHADEADAALAMFEEAFSEFEDRLPGSPATWRALTIEREGFEPEDLMVAVDRDDVVGGAFLIDAEEVWVDKLAVRRTHRHRGIARALLAAAFRRSFDRGYRHTSLSTDSNTGALSLYERVGMRAVESYTHYAIDL